MKSLLVALISLFCIPLAAQTEYDDLEFEMDSITKPYKPKGKHYVYLKSKRGSGGMPTTSSGDSINSIPITDIILVYTETDASDFAERAKANRSRWKNLISTYPEYFDYSSTYKNVCQCNPNGDTAAFKRVQGFYVYYQSDEPDEPEAKAAVVAPAVVAAKTAEKTTSREEEKPKAKEKEKSKAAEESPAPAREADKPRKSETAKQKEEEKKAEPVAKEETKKNSRQEEEPAEEAEPVVAAKPAKKKPTAAAANKPRKAKDPKACRPACYGYGDEDLNAFFADNIKLTKKQKKKGKNLLATVALQLNVDGTIKRVSVTGPNPEFNTQVQEAAQGMNAWNAQVKNGVTIKSQVRITLKFDKPSKSMKPSEVVVMPKPAPKCQCVSDSEMFGD
jgi:hypothetical protein